MKIHNITDWRMEATARLMNEGFSDIDIRRILDALGLLVIEYGEGFYREVKRKQEASRG